MMDFDDFISKLEVHDMSYLNEMPRIECAVNVQERVKYKGLKLTERKRERMKEINDELAEYELGMDLRMNIKHEGEHGFLIMERKWFGFGSVCGYRVKEDGCMKKMWKSLVGCMKKK